jgi:hypothetical protein
MCALRYILLNIVRLPVHLVKHCGPSGTPHWTLCTFRYTLLNIVRLPVHITEHCAPSGTHYWTLCAFRYTLLNILRLPVHLAKQCAPSGTPYWTLCAFWYTLLNNLRPPVHITEQCAPFGTPYWTLRLPVHLTEHCSFRNTLLNIVRLPEHLTEQCAPTGTPYWTQSYGTWTCFCNHVQERETPTLMIQRLPSPPFSLTIVSRWHPPFQLRRETDTVLESSVFWVLWTETRNAALTCVHQGPTKAWGCGRQPGCSDFLRKSK